MSTRNDGANIGAGARRERWELGVPSTRQIGKDVTLQRGMRMNREKYRRQVETLSGGFQVDATKMPTWFEGVLGVLEALGEQKAAIRHPGHRGSARESPLEGTLNEMLPSGMVAAKGFALNPLMATSNEQDLLVVDRNVAGEILPGKSSYYPIEACVASVQVKSNLTRATIREAIVNCVSLKNLGMFEDDSPFSSGNDGVCFGVFSYRSAYGLGKLAEVVNEELEGVERQYWPNLFYVLGKGMLVPADDQERISLGQETMFTGSRFCTVGAMGVEPAIEKSEAYPFLWFLTNIIDHCVEQRKKRQSPVYKQYWLKLFGIHTKFGAGARS